MGVNVRELLKKCSKAVANESARIILSRIQIKNKEEEAATSESGSDSEDI